MSWIDSSTKLYGVLGRGISYTLSPAIHNYIFMEVGYNAVYLAFDVPVEKIDVVGKALVEICEGLNVTIPYKEVIMKYLYSIDRSAEVVGAVNTVHRGRGYNTDYIALVNILRKYSNILRSSICYIYGAGGASRAAAVALHSYGCEIYVVNRSLERAKNMATYLSRSGIDIHIHKDCVKRADVVVNATPNPSVVPDKCLEGSRLVIEFVYIPVETTLVRRARTRGIEVIDGLTILVKQALEAHKIWLGIEFPEEKVLRYLYARKLIR